ncbi:MAG: alkaline phosphatase D family protein [Bryobacteraceae bacterium]|nr:alkaline phosphatase D family protein [Bryobacteraceae bacterium]MDW8380069.1 alkaline phosphatase D family protein [Bryobacterales bacterium]
MRDQDFERRRFLIHSGQWLGLLALGPVDRIAASPKFEKNPFTLGVAAGDPAPDGFVIWTRLAPEPLAGGGMPQQAVEVDWMVAEDENFSRGLRKGKALADPKLGHSIHVELQGLRPSYWYYYRFRAGKFESPVGRAKTAPTPSASPDQLRFAFASCQHYEAGFYTAYQHMAEEDLDLVIHLGDYIYEGGIGKKGVRQHNSAEILSLNDYRNRYALYKSDELLQRAHARFPWIVTWDDHEVDNDYAGEASEDDQPRAAFLERRANAYQAYYEHMPLRKQSLPSGSSLLLYRRIRFGRLAEFSVLDTRQYRSDQPCGGGRAPLCEAARDARQTMLGEQQEKWLYQGLAASGARWNVLAQQVMMAGVDLNPGPGELFSMDKWNGYVLERARLLSFLADQKISNPIVITGDIHSNWALNLHCDPERPESPVVGAEFVGTSISSTGDGVDFPESIREILSENPHVRFFNAQRGYVRCSVKPSLWQADYRVVSMVTKPGAPIHTRASFVVEHGKPGLEKA